MSSPKVLILTALFPEARAIARAFHWSPDFDENPMVRDATALAVVGPRAARLAEVTASIRPRAVIMAGIAAGLAPQVAVGDVVADGSFPTRLPVDPAIRIHRGAIATVDRILDTPATKRALHEKTGAIAADMETQIAREHAASLGVPFLALRAISDAADDYLDPELVHFVDNSGRTRNGKAAMYALTHPQRIGHLMQIGAATRRALESLVHPLVALLASGWPDGGDIASSFDGSARRISDKIDN